MELLGDQGLFGEVARRSGSGIGCRFMHLATLTLVLLLLAVPLAIEAQPAGKLWRVGYLSSSSAERERTRVAAFQQGLRELGYLEGKSIVIEQRYARGEFERLPELAAELARLKVDVFVVAGAPATHAAHATAPAATGHVAIAGPKFAGHKFRQHPRSMLTATSRAGPADHCTERFGATTSNSAEARPRTSALSQLLSGLVRPTRARGEFLRVPRSYQCHGAPANGGCITRSFRPTEYRSGGGLVEVGSSGS